MCLVRIFWLRSKSARLINLSQAFNSRQAKYFCLIFPPRNLFCLLITNIFFIYFNKKKIALFYETKKSNFPLWLENKLWKIEYIWDKWRFRIDSLMWAFSLMEQIIEWLCSYFGGNEILANKLLMCNFFWGAKLFILSVKKIKVNFFFELNVWVKLLDFQHLLSTRSNRVSFTSRQTQNPIRSLIPTQYFGNIEFNTFINYLPKERFWNLRYWWNRSLYIYNPPPSLFSHRENHSSHLEYYPKSYKRIFRFHQQYWLYLSSRWFYKY